MRVCFLSNYPVPYQRELLLAVEAAGEIEVQPFFLASRDPSRQWPDERTIPRARVPRSLGLPGAPAELRIHPSLVGDLLRTQADIHVICGYSHAAFQLAMAALVAARRPFVNWAELPRIGQGSALARIARRTLIAPLNLSRGLLAIGTRAAETWRQVLRPAIPIVNYPYSCDIQRYGAIRRQPRRERPFTFLFSGQLIERKGVDLLLRAFEEACRERSDLHLRIAGDGPLRRRLEEAVPISIRDRVKFLGFIPWEQLPATYAAADALVVPSRHDGWALVVNEALAAEMPIIASDAVGAAFDLVREGITGYRVISGDISALAAAMTRIPEQAAQMGRAGRVLAETLTPAAAAHRLFELLKSALRNELQDSIGPYP